LNQITPVLLTYNEEQNIGRTLSQLVWARDIVVVDSGSTDNTVTIVREFPQVRLFTRRFDTHANQWRYATKETGIVTEWILRLDADYHLSDVLIAQLTRLEPDTRVNAYRIGFDYAIFSHELISSLYPPSPVLLRKGQFAVSDRGHTEAWDVKGPIASLTARIMHDDWKRTDQWLTAQIRYMQRELERLSTGASGLVRWLRLRPPLMPIAVFIYCLLGKGLLFNGRAGIFYALQRLVAEAVLSLMVLEEKLRGCAGHDPRMSGEAKIKDAESKARRRG
jgi:glycosyltransferase involved in cell wall biosynthesis